MGVRPLAEDKPKIAFYGAMMAIQNFGFFIMYFFIFNMIPISVPGVLDCNTVRFWVGFFALDCFIESFCVLWMAMGGYIADNCMFTFGWFLHLFVALPYCISTAGVPIAIFSSEGTLCRAAMGPAGLTLVSVYYVHAALFMVYVWMMLSITYYSFIKPTFIKTTKVADASLK